MNLKSIIEIATMCGVSYEAIRKRVANKNFTLAKENPATIDIEEEDNKILIDYLKQKHKNNG